MGDIGDRGILIEARKKIFTLVENILNGEVIDIDLEPGPLPDSQEEIEYLLGRLLEIRNDLSGLERLFNGKLTGGNLTENMLPQLNLREIINSLESSKKRSLWLQDELKKDIIIPPGANHHEFFFERIERPSSDGGNEETLFIIAHNGISLNVSGPKRLIDYIQAELSSAEKVNSEPVELWTEHEILHGIPLPASTFLLDNEIRSLKTRFIDLRDKARDIVDQIEHLLVP